MTEMIESLQKDAAKRKRQGQKSGGRGKKKTLASCDAKVSPKQRKTAAKVANISKTSVASIERTKAVKENAPDLFDQMEQGKLKTNAAYNQMRQRQKAKELADKAKAAKQMMTDEPTWLLICSEVLDGLQSVLDHHAPARLIFADPPYNIGVDYGSGVKADNLDDATYMKWVSQWLAKCEEVLSDDGSLWVMIGDEYAAEYVCELKKLGFYIRSWIKWYETFGVNCANNFNRTSRHILYCVRDPKKFVFNASAVTRPSDRQTKYNDKRACGGGKVWDNVWQIPRLTGTCEERIPGVPTQIPVELVRAIVGCASEPGDLVVDPFNGSGTTGVACIELDRRYIGIDQSEAFIDIAHKRLTVAST